MQCILKYAFARPGIGKFAIFQLEKIRTSQVCEQIGVSGVAPEAAQLF
jgi:hypothetical protein